MVAATTLALFFVPLFYFLVTSLTDRLSGRKAAAGAQAIPAAPTQPPKEEAPDA